MKRTIAGTILLIVAVCAQSRTSSGAESVAAPTVSWASVLGEQCRRCYSAKPIREAAPVPIPERAVVYSFTGEFSSQVDWWLIDLDTGQIIRWEAISNETREGKIITTNRKRKTTTTHFGKVNPSALKRVRTSAARLWRSKPPKIIVISPGTIEEDFVVSGSRQVSFDWFASDDQYIVAAVNASLPADAAIVNGAFVVPPRH